MERRLLSWSRVVSLLSSTVQAMQAPGSCRWRELVLHIAGMSQGRCEKPDSFCLLKLLVHSLVADKFPGILISHHLGRLLIPLGKKYHAENQCDIKQDFASREDGEKSCLQYPLHLRSSCWFRQAHSHPKSNPATPATVLSRVNHRLCSLRRPLLHQDAAACCS